MHTFSVASLVLVLQAKCSERSIVHHIHTFPSLLQYLPYHGQHLGGSIVRQQRLFGYTHPKPLLHCSAWDDSPRSDLFSFPARSSTRVSLLIDGSEGSLSLAVGRGEAAVQAAKRSVKEIEMCLTFISIVAVAVSAKVSKADSVLRALKGLLNPEGRVVYIYIISDLALDSCLSGDLNQGHTIVCTYGNIFCSVVQEVDAQNSVFTIEYRHPNAGYTYKPRGF